MNTLDLAQRKVKMRKVSGTNGGEWQGPCPGCGGEDRFHVWPNENDGRGGYWCRQCGKTGDNIQYLREFEGMGFKDACNELGIDLPDRPPAAKTASVPASPRAPEPTAAPSFEPSEAVPPADLWQEKAGKFIAWAEGNLQKNVEALQWLAERGISAETAAAFRLGWNWGEPVTITDAHSPRSRDIYRPRKSWGLPEVLKDDGRPRALWIPVGLVIPYVVERVVYRIRIRRPEGEPRYYVLPGSSSATMIVGRDRRAFVVVESELDAIACAAAGPLAGSVALGSVAAKPDAEAFEVLNGALQILNALDYDAAGAKAMAWWRDNFPRCDRWPVPKGKDPGDAVRMGIDLNQWIKTGLPPALTLGEPQTAREAAPGGAIGAGLLRGEGPHAQPDIPDGSLRGVSPIAAALKSVAADLPPALRELYDLLRKNPSVKIINSPARFTVLRDGKYVGGRINELVFRTPEVTDYLLSHPAEEIDGGNFIVGAG
jgi:hypothetical protein